jgi:hypothetical protein
MLSCCLADGTEICRSANCTEIIGGLVTYGALQFKCPKIRAEASKKRRPSDENDAKTNPSGANKSRTLHFVQIEFIVAGIAHASRVPKLEISN